MTAQTEYGECRLETFGINVAVTRADERILISDGVVNAAASPMFMHYDLDGNLVIFPYSWGDHGRVVYELVAWDADAHAHVAIRREPAPKRRATPRPRPAGANA